MTLVYYFTLLPIFFHKNDKNIKFQINNYFSATHVTDFRMFSEM